MPPLKWINGPRVTGGLYYYTRKAKKVNNGTQSSRRRSNGPQETQASSKEVTWRQLELSFVQSHERTEAGDKSDDLDAWGLLRLSFDNDTARHVFEFEIPSELGELLFDVAGEPNRLAVSTSIELLALRLRAHVQDDGVLFGQCICRLSRIFRFD